MKRLLIPALLLLTASPAWATFTVQQHTINSSTANSNTLNVTVNSTTAGWSIVVGAGYKHGGGTITGVSDNASGGTNTYTQATSAASSAAGPGIVGDIWYSLNTPRGSVTTVTITYSATDTSAKVGWVWVVSNNGGTPTFDIANHVNDQTTVSSIATGASVTTTSSSGFIVSLGLVNNGVFDNPLIGNEFTSGGDRDTTGAATFFGGVSLISSSAATHSAQWTGNASVSYCSSTAAIKEGGTAAPAGINKKKKLEKVDLSSAVL